MTSVKTKTQELDLITDLISKFTSAINQKDAGMVAACFVADGSFTNPAGRTADGRQAIQQLHEPLFAATQIPGVPSFYNAVLEIDPPAIRFITADVATISFRWNQSGVLAPDGSAWPLRKGLINITAAQNNGEWLFVVFHNMELKN